MMRETPAPPSTTDAPSEAKKSIRERVELGIVKMKEGYLERKQKYGSKLLHERERHRTLDASGELATETSALRNHEVTLAADIRGKNDPSQDSVAKNVSEGRGMAVAVADGISTAPMSELGSQLVSEFFTRACGDQFQDILEDVKRNPNADARQFTEEYLLRVMTEARDLAGENSTTLTGAVVYEDQHGELQMSIAHAGDSRLYEFVPPDQLTMLTVDHSLANFAQQQANEVQGKRREQLQQQADFIAQNSAYREMIVQSIAKRRKDLAKNPEGYPPFTRGNAGEYTNVFTIPVKEGATYILTSDGVTDNMIRQDDPKNAESIRAVLTDAARETGAVFHPALVAQTLMAQAAENMKDAETYKGPDDFGMIVMNIIERKRERAENLVPFPDQPARVRNVPEMPTMSMETADLLKARIFPKGFFEKGMKLEGVKKMTKRMIAFVEERAPSAEAIGTLPREARIAETLDAIIAKTVQGNEKEKISTLELTPELIDDYLLEELNAIPEYAVQEGENPEDLEVIEKYVALKEGAKAKLLEDYVEGEPGFLRTYFVIIDESRKLEGIPEEKRTDEQDRALTFLRELRNRYRAHVPDVVSAS